MVGYLAYVYTGTRELYDQAIIWVEEESRIIWAEEEEEEGTIVYSVIHSTLYIWFILIHMKSNYKLQHKTIYFFDLFFISLKKKIYNVSRQKMNLFQNGMNFVKVKINHAI